jgi:C-terminal processing protease CtpA/Prc
MRMGYGFGLLGLLVVVAIAIVWFSQTQIPIARKGKQTQDVARQISGHGPDGESAQHSVKLDFEGKDGKTEDLLVTDVTPGGALDQYFGLKKGDRIIKIGEFPVRDYPGGDDLAEAAVFEAAQKQQPLVVRRGAQEVTLSPPAVPQLNVP